MELTIHLLFNGTRLTAMPQYAEVLAGEIVGVIRNADAPRWHAVDAELWRHPGAALREYVS
jgi:hypothetical protein